TLDSGDYVDTCTGSIAAGQQAASNPIAAKGIFATLQSAGAGGYGLPVVKVAARTGSVVVNAAPKIAAALYHILSNQEEHHPAGDDATLGLNDREKTDVPQQNSGKEGELTDSSITKDSDFTGLKKVKSKL
ncbi:MAG: hypothetical protein Q9224_007211, partial [Gallowayella concinna]